jgi:enoyl-CoA hydratase/carnithine racemase
MKQETPTPVASDAHVRLLRQGGVAHLVLNQPEKRNALAFDMWDAIPRLVAEAEADPAIAVVVLRGEGAHFSAGADISEFAARRTDPDDVARYGETVEQAERALLALRKPSIAMISGFCLGGGCELALACDMRIAAADAVLGITASRLGIVYSFLSTRRLVTAVGASFATYMLTTGAHVRAEEALRVRLVDQLVPAEDLAATVDQVAHTIDQRSQVSVRGALSLIAKIVDGATEPDEEAVQLPLRAARSRDYREGVAAFLAKRRPIFTDR